MFKKRISLPQTCKEVQCEHYRKICGACSECPEYLKSIEERDAKRQDAHRKAANKYYHKTQSDKS